MNLKLEKIIKMKSLTILCLLLMLAIGAVSCRPSDRKPAQPRTQIQDVVAEFHDMDPAEFERIRRCYEDDDTMELCQRCAKATKVRNAFPMCCSNEDSAQDWCKDYVYYGIQY
ncbi:uncharacterized protein LOC132255646 [Phlebotomus argentipes]|uniref:uncharacterized protein LOC132255646 n=1 Tax=Phlebotomus argentipes TaxID=94469 RepID=UPI0028932BFD|nr:uncharacterized protein LOC132255646 [Phlebotomus argentipes]